MYIFLTYTTNSVPIYTHYKEYPMPQAMPNYHTQLNERAVVHIRTLVKEGKSLQQIKNYLIKQFNITASREAIRQAANGTTWARLTDPPPLKVPPKPLPTNGRLSDEQVIQIRTSAKKEVIDLDQLAEKHNVSRITINSMLNGNTYKHLNKKAPPVYRRRSANRERNTNLYYK